MDDLKLQLQQFTGTNNWYRHVLVPHMLYTDGVKYFAETAGAYWLLDIVATELMQLLSKEPFLAIELCVSSDDTAILSAEDGNYGRLYRRFIEFTNCPHGMWKFFLTDRVLLLPSEY